MDQQKLNVFILADNALVVNGLRNNLANRFQQKINVTCFYDSKSCLKKVDQNTQAVILDYFLEGKSCLPTLKCIQAINPNTRIVMHSSKEDVTNVIDSLIKGETIYASALNYKDKMATQYR